MMDGAFHIADEMAAELADLQTRYEFDMARAARRTKHRERQAKVRGIMDGLLSQLGPGDLVLDCGANVGDIAQPLAETGAEVYAFESDPTAFATLTERLADFDNAHPVNAALGVTSGGDVLSLPDILTELLAGNIPDALPRLSNRKRKPGRLALLKMDVGGAEMDLLPALHELDLLDPIGCTLVKTYQRKFPDLRRDFFSMRRQIGGLYSRRKVNLDWV